MDALVELDRLNMGPVIEAAGGTFDPGFRRRKIQEECAQGARFVVVCRDGRAVAYLEYMPRSGGQWDVMAIQVHPDYQQGSVLRDLLIEAHEQLLRRLPEVIKSSVHITNEKSLSLHENLGFTKAGTEGDRVLFEIAGKPLHERLKRFRKKPHNDLFNRR